MSAFKEDLRRLRSELLSLTQEVQVGEASGSQPSSREIEPEELRSLIREMVASSDLKPAMLCFLASRVDEYDSEATEGDRDHRDQTADSDSSASVDVSKCAGIQLIHTGLCRIREIVDDPSSWEDVGLEPVEEDMELLGADILVSIGLGRLGDDLPMGTRVINSFGSSQARKIDTDDPESVVEEDAVEYTQAYLAAVSIGADGDPDDEVVEVAERLALRDASSVSSETEPDPEEYVSPRINGYLEDVIESGSLGLETEAEQGL